MGLLCNFLCQLTGCCHVLIFYLRRSQRFFDKVSSIWGRDSKKCAHPSKCKGIMMASGKAWAAATASSAVKVRCAAPTSGTRAAPMNKMAIRISKRRQLNALPVSQTDCVITQPFGPCLLRYNLRRFFEKSSRCAIKIIKVMVMAEQHGIDMTEGLNSHSRSGYFP